MIIETENYMYQELLHTVYGYLLNEKCAHLDLDKLEKIVIVSNNKLPDNVDARYKDGLVLIKEESVKNSLSYTKERDVNKYIFQEVRYTSDNKTELLIDNVMMNYFTVMQKRKCLLCIV